LNRWKTFFQTLAYDIEIAPPPSKRRAAAEANAAAADNHHHLERSVFTPASVVAKAQRSYLSACSAPLRENKCF
jgi:hypothetical protein